MWPDIPGIVPEKARTRGRKGSTNEDFAEISDFVKEAAARLTLPRTEKITQPLRAGMKEQTGMNLIMEKENRIKEEKNPSPREELSMTTKATRRVSLRPKARAITGKESQRARRTSVLKRPRKAKQRNPPRLIMDHGTFSLINIRICGIPLVKSVGTHPTRDEHGTPIILGQRPTSLQPELKQEQPQLLKKVY